MIRKGIAALLCLLFGAMSMGAAESAPLSLEELFAWRDAVLGWTREEAMRSGPLPLEGLERWICAYPFGIVELSNPATDTPQNHIASVEILRQGRTCPRGIAVGDPLAKVLAAYPNENPALAGNRHSAALYLREGGAEDEGYGLLLRNGQAAECAQHVAATRAQGMEGFYRTVLVSYVIDGGQVSSIRVKGFANLSMEMEKNANFSSVRALGSETSYTPKGLVSGPFGAADLIFSGLDFAVAVQADCQRLFGEPLEYAEKGGVRSMAYPDIAIEINPAFGDRVDAIAVMGEAVEGPRGIRVGDAQQGVMDLFGGDAAETLVYTFVNADGQQYTLKCIFFSGVLTEYQVTRR